MQNTSTDPVTVLQYVQYWTAHISSVPLYSMLSTELHTYRLYRCTVRSVLNCTHIVCTAVQYVQYWTAHIPYVPLYSTFSTELHTYRLYRCTVRSVLNCTHTVCTAVPSVLQQSVCLSPPVFYGTLHRTYFGHVRMLLYSSGRFVGTNVLQLQLF
jgi:hypothetical protein